MIGTTWLDTMLSRLFFSIVVELNLVRFRTDFITSLNFLSYLWEFFQTILALVGRWPSFRGYPSEPYGHMRTAPMRPCTGSLGFLGPSLNTRVSYQWPCDQIRVCTFLASAKALHHRPCIQTCDPTLCVAWFDRRTWSGFTFLVVCLGRGQCAYCSI